MPLHRILVYVTPRYTYSLNMGTDSLNLGVDSLDLKNQKGVDALDPEEQKLLTATLQSIETQTELQRLELLDKVRSRHISLIHF